ncbi:hypothetical protein F2S72_09455 [Pseudomonas syringae pv. actinidiae]|nr:hypothetical protein [Pseudomonas syringae pv. actinidiae]
MSKTFTRTITLSVSPVTTGNGLDNIELSRLTDNALLRLQNALGSLIEGGLLSGTLTYQDQTPAVNVLWTIEVTDSPTAQ